MRLNYSGSGYAKPFPHTIIDDFISQDVVSKINQDWPEDWEKEDGSFTKKWHTQSIPQSALDVIRSIDIREVQKATGIENLIEDPELFGAGLHCIPSGGFLNMHCDFNQHPNGWARRVNMLIYLNQEWAWNGYLNLGFKKEICPIAGRAVIFETNEKTWHGHPEPLNCPEHIQRRSIAIYYYTDTKPPKKPHSTIYKK